MVNCKALATICLAILSLALTFTGGVWCKMLKIESNVSGVPDFYTSPYLVRKTVVTGFAPVPDFFSITGLAPEEVLVQDECESFLDEDYVSTDTKWRSSIILHTIGLAVGDIICLVLILSMCCEWSTNFYRMTGCAWILICTMFTGLIFLALDSDLCTDNPILEELQIQDLYRNECKIGSGSIMLIIGVAGLFLTGVVNCVIKGKDAPPKAKEEEKKEEKQKDVEEPTNDPEPEEPTQEAEPDEPAQEPAAEPATAAAAATVAATTAAAAAATDPEPEPEPVEEPATESVKEPEPAKKSFTKPPSNVTSSGTWIAD